MVQNLIRIKDIINNKEFVYNTEYNLESGFLKCFKSIMKNDNINDKENVNYAIYENHCEIFYEEEIIKKGWVWNSTKQQKNIIYILTYIPIYSEKEIKESNKETQVGKGIVEKRDYGTQKDFNYICEESDSDNSSDSKKSLVSTILDELTTTVNIDWCYNELEPVIQNFNNLNLGNGYANNPFFPKEFDIELKKQLSKPKYGLKPIVE
jgi:hypothetical protein